jgi:hypothetical protein
VFTKLSMCPYPEPDQSSPYHPILSQRSILISSTHIRLGLPSGIFLSGFPTHTLYEFLFSPFVLHALSISHPPWLDHANYIWQRIQVMKLPIMQFPPISCHIISLQSKHSPQHPILRHPQSMCLS